jgi:anti-sigma B factor antagonist
MHTAVDQDDALLASSPRLAPDIIDPLLELEVRRAGRTVTIALKGDLDSSTVFELREVLAQILSERVPHELVLDLLELKYVDSTGLSAFLLAHQRAMASGFRFALANPNRVIARLCDLSALTGTLDITPLPAPSRRDGSRASHDAGEGPVWDPVSGVATL